MANSTAIVTDLTTVSSNISATQAARCIAAAGPILDPNGVVNLLILKAQEMKALLTYLTYGNANASGSQGGSQAPFQSGDSNAAQTYTLLVNVYNDLG